jgi:hypothetical protein
MGKHLTVYGADTLRTNLRSSHSLDYFGDDSPTRKAQIAIEGETKLLNPWINIYESAPNAITQAGTLEIILDDPFWGSEDEQLAVLWDNDILVAKKSVIEGDTVFVDVPQILGERLQIWMTDNNGANVRFITSQRKAQAAEAKNSEKKGSDLSDKLASVGAGVQESTSNLKWTIGGLAIIALSGAAVWFSLKK